jgi:hypothetical protein
MSQTYYHVDRGDELAPGDTLALESPGEWRPQVDAALSEYYPGGLSHHGRHYSTQHLHGADSDDLWDFSCEVIFELVRGRRFPERPSRLQSVFGFESPADVEAFLEDFGDPPYTVWEVRADRGFRADMNLVDAVDFARGLYRADYYWRGETFVEDPLWEVLLVPPVEVVRAVEL